MTKLRAWALVALTLVVSATMLPPGVAVVGAVLGGLSSLLAIGLVLAYRAHRFLNLAHASLGAVAGSVVSYLVGYAHWSFWLALPVGLLVGACVGVAAGVLLGERLADASRMVVVAASLGLAFVFGAAHVALGLMTGSVLAFEVPIRISLDVFPVRLGGTHAFAALVVPVALLGVWAFLQRSDHGLRVRALAGGARHARRIGVEPHRAWRLLWIVIGVLAAAAGIASQPLLGTTVERGPLLGPLLLALAAAAFGGMRHLPLTVGASIALGVAYQAILWRSPVAAVADIGLLLVIVTAFAFRASTSRLDERHDPPHHRLVRAPRPAAARFRSVLAVARVVAAVSVIACAVVVLPHLAPGDAQRVGAIGIFVLAGLSVHVVTAYRGSLPLGTWALVGAGAIVAGRVDGGSIRGLVAAVVAGALASLLLALLAERGGALAYAAVTLGAAFAFAAVARHLPFGAARIQRLGPIAIDQPAGAATLVVAVCACVAVALAYLRHTRLGRDALALREDPRLAAVHGVRSMPTKLAIDCVAGAVAGLAGALYLWNQRVIHPDAFQAVRSLELVAITITGGTGSVLGPFLGSAVVKGSELFAWGPLQLLATGTGLLIVVVWLRGGLVSLAEVIRRRVTSRSPVDLAVGETPEVVARFCPAPAAETRKARHDATVRHLASSVLVVACAAGIAIRLIVADRDPAAVVWIAFMTSVLGAVGAAIAHERRPHLVGAAAAAVGGSALAVVWTPALIVVPIAAGYVAGSALESAGRRVAHVLAHASRGWIALQLVAGIVIGVVVAGTSHPRVWLTAVALAGLIVAAAAFPRPTRSDTGVRSAETILSLVSASVTLGGTSILRGADLQVRPGEVVGIIGANGVGKTTLLRCLAGETPIERGSVFLRHTDVTVLSPDERFALGIMLSDADDGSNGELTVRENLRLVALAAHDRSSTRDVIDVVGRLHPSLEERLDDRAAVLSGGERRLLALAQVAVAQPTVLLIDELARGLSAEAVDTYRALLRGMAARGAAVVVVDHDVVGLTHVADRILRLGGGRLQPEERRVASPVVPSGATR